MTPRRKSSTRRNAIAAALILTCATTASAATPSLTDLRVAAGKAERVPNVAALRVPVRVSWANSWRTAKNHDAVWLFVKIRPKKGGAWRHTRLRAVESLSTTPRLTCTLAGDRVGAFCAPAAAYRGSVTASVTLDVDASGLPQSLLITDSIETEVYGIEMVYVPDGPPTLGDLDTTATIDTSTQDMGAVEEPPEAQPSQQDLVRRAVLDYVEGFYEGDSTKLVRSVSPDVFKYGYWIPRDSTKYSGERMTWPEFHAYANQVKKSGRTQPATAPKEVVVYDVLDQTASAKLTAYWGVDYLLLAKQDGRWKITHVLWQTAPKK